MQRLHLADQAVQLVIGKVADHQGKAFAGLDIVVKSVFFAVHLPAEDAGIIPKFERGIDGLFGFVNL